MEREAVEADRLAEWLAAADANSWAEYLDWCRQHDAPPPHGPVHTMAMATATAYAESHPGLPLGPGMPTGRPLRLDGESHDDAWARIVRRDPCSYCDKPVGTTLDHVEPRSRTARGLGGVYCWNNYVSACESCNSHKGSRSLLGFLLARRGGRPATAAP